MNVAYDLALRYAQARFTAELMTSKPVKLEDVNFDAECERFAFLYDSALAEFEGTPLTEPLEM